MDPRLLSRADADDLPVERERDGVGLRVSQRDQPDDQVALGVIGQRPLLGDDVLEQAFIDRAVIAPLLERHAEDVARLARARLVPGVDLEHEIAAVLTSRQGSRTPAERYDGVPFTDRGFDNIPALRGVAELLTDLLQAA